LSAVGATRPSLLIGPVSAERFIPWADGFAEAAGLVWLIYTPLAAIQGTQWLLLTQACAGPVTRLGAATALATSPGSRPEAEASALPRRRVCPTATPRPLRRHFLRMGARAANGGWPVDMKLDTGGPEHRRRPVSVRVGWDRLPLFQALGGGQLRLG
jgi:hypothetical protein